MTDKKHYRNYPEDVLYSDEYAEHVSAMTSEELHSKSDIALELAYRDLIIKGVRAKMKELESCISGLLAFIYAECELSQIMGNSSIDKANELRKSFKGGAE